MYGFTERMKLINVKIIFVLLAVLVSFLIIYSIKFSFFNSFSITAKALQFNFGYFFLIPGFSILFGLFPSIKMEKILAVTFWVITAELLLEFLLIRVLGVSPGSFTHYPKVAHITLDKATGVYTADRLLGLAGNASVTGVLYSASFALYLGTLISDGTKFLNARSIPVIVVFVMCFFMIISGSAFFAILLSLFIVWSQKKGSLTLNLLIALFVIPSVLFLFDYVSSLTDAFGSKFKIEYLVFLLSRDDVQGSLPYLLNEILQDYHWYNLFVGSYYFEWGNENAVIRTVDYFYVNLVYEFGLIGLAVFFYIIKLAYNAIKKRQIINENYLKFGFLIIVVGSLHYPAIAYMASQIFLSAIAGIAIRDSALNDKNLSSNPEITA